VTRRTPSSFRPRGTSASHVRGLDTSDFPVESVSWDDAVDFCRRLSERKEEAGRVYRLPTEAEWEYACRAWGAALAFHFGPRLMRGRGWFDWWAGTEKETAEEEERPTRPCPVGQLPPNAFGLYDMHGNVDEWCLDWYDKDYYEQSARE